MEARQGRGEKPRKAVVSVANILMSDPTGASAT